MVKCNKNELKLKMTINNNNDNNGNTAIEDDYNSHECADQNKEQCFLSNHVIIVNLNKKLITGRSLTDILSNLNNLQIYTA